MTMFRAKLQNPDWQGTAAAVDVEIDNLARLLRHEGLLDREIETLVGVELYVGEDYGGRMRLPHVRVLIAEGRDDDEVSEWLKECGDPVPLKAVEVKLTMEEFAGLFRHLKLVLTRTGLGLEGRRYREHT